MPAFPFSYLGYHGGLIGGTMIKRLITIAFGLMLTGTQISNAQAPDVEELKTRAAQGDANAQDNLGTLYSLGAGVERNAEEAVRYYRLAAEQGRAAAQYNLGNMYASGEGVAQDNMRAYMWYDIAALQGDEDGPFGRDLIGALLTPDEIAQAQEMARRCMASNYEDC
jgi:hypothetical protein